ncbi:MAG TPA: hypothetical protein PKC49_15265, partial [Phycisphaerae bacterium]|nr:hypothetical protein [Phycisphaerae bacterium]
MDHSRRGRRFAGCWDKYPRVSSPCLLDAGRRRGDDVWGRRRAQGALCCKKRSIAMRRSAIVGLLLLCPGLHGCFLIDLLDPA